MHKQYIPINYEWLIDLAPDSKLRAKDICEVYGIKQRSLLMRVSRGQFPEHDHTVVINGFVNQQHYWYASTVIKQVRKDLTMV